MTRPTATPRDSKPAPTPKLRFPGFTESWTYEPLAKVLTEHKLKNTAGRDVFSVSMEFGIVNQIELLGRSFAAADTSHYTIGRRYDVVYTKSPLKAFPFGIVKQSKFDGEVALSPLYGVFTPSNPYLGLMIEAYFESPNRSKDFLAPLCQKGAKNTLQITNTTFLSGRLPLPTQPAEQRKIAECLSTLDELIGAESQKLDALKAHKKGLMQQLFPREGETLPRLRFPEFHSAPEWSSARLEDLCELITKGTTPTSYGFEYVSSGVRFVKIESLLDGAVDLSKTAFITTDCHETFLRSQLREHDLIFSIAGALGLVAIVGSGVLPANINQALALIRLKGGLSSRFFLHYLGSSSVQALVQRIRSGAAQPNLSLGQLGDFEILFPSAPEQHRIATCLRSLDDLIAAQSDRLATLQTHKQGLLQQLFPSPADATI
jgi:type I restriction enzyme S subunit